MEKFKTKKEKVALYAKKTGIKIYQLADLAQMPRTSLYRWVKGNGDIKLSQWERLDKIINRIK